LAHCSDPSAADGLFDLEETDKDVAEDGWFDAEAMDEDGADSDGGSS
jgi:hypothetical protein